MNETAVAEFMAANEKKKFIPACVRAAPMVQCKSRFFISPGAHENKMKSRNAIRSFCVCFGLKISFLL